MSRPIVACCATASPRGEATQSARNLVSLYTEPQLSGGHSCVLAADAWLKLGGGRRALDGWIARRDRLLRVLLPLQLPLQRVLLLLQLLAQGVFLLQALFEACRLGGLGLGLGLGLGV